MYLGVFQETLPVETRSQPHFLAAELQADEEQATLLDKRVRNQHNSDISAVDQLISRSGDTEPTKLIPLAAGDDLAISCTYTNMMLSDDVELGIERQDYLIEYTFRFGVNSSNNASGLSDGAAGSVRLLLAKTLYAAHLNFSPTQAE